MERGMVWQVRSEGGESVGWGGVRDDSVKRR